MTPYINDPDFRLYVGDVREVLAELEPGSVDCCVTSPPYLGLRDYGHESQIGLEGTLGEYVAALVDVFREVRRVLTPTATCWLNLGDSYNSAASNQRNEMIGGWDAGMGRSTQIEGTLKTKDLMGVPWRVALALQDDGWYLRSDIIWSKPNPMPESVTDRPTKSHEYVFLLSKGPRYFFDQEAVREPHTPDGRNVSTRTVGNGSHGNYQEFGHEEGRERWPNGGRNIRSVWEIATQPYPDAHFATFPEALPERCIKAGCPEQVCVTCGKPRERLMQKEGESSYEAHKRKTGETWQDLNERHREQGKAVNGTGKNTPGTLNPTPRSTQGWSDCGHNNWRPGTVLDPFMGSGTTAKVARRLGRRSVGVELNEEYAALCAKRLQQLSLLAETAA